MAMCAMYVRPEGGMDLPRIVQRVFRKLEWKLDYVAAVMKTDAATLSRGLNGMGPLDLTKFAHMPSRFWWKFFRSIFAEILRHEERERESVRRSA